MSTPAPRDESPLARDIGDLVTPRQLENIRRGARAAGVSEEETSVTLFDCDVGGLSRAAASQLIAHLAQLAQGVRRREGCA